MRVKNEYLVAVITKIVMMFFGLFESIILARYLGAALKGQLAYINSITQTCFIIATLGIYAAYPYYRKQMDKQELLDKTMSITLVMFVVYTIIAVFIALAVHSVSIEWFYIALLTPILFYDKVVSFVWMIEEPNKRNGVVLVAATAKLAYYVFLFYCTKPSLLFGVTMLLVAPLLESIYFTLTLKFSFSLKYCRRDSIMPLISYGFLPMVAVLLTTLNYRIDIIMLRRYETVSLAAIGVYSVGITLAEKVLLVSDAAKEILLSKLAKGKGTEEVAKVMRFCFFVAFVLAVCVTIISKLFISIMYGAEYTGAEVVTNISVWGTIFMVFFKMISQYNVANHKQHYNVIFLGVAIVLNILMNALFIPRFGINGAAIATALGYLISSMLFVVYFHNITGISYRDLTIINKNDFDLVLNKLKKKKGQETR